jgi:2'-5' RNA ligase
MQALVTTFPKPYEDQILALWQDLKEKFGLQYIENITVPHFTWHICDAYELEAVTPLLERIAAEVEPFEILVEDVGTFISQSPVVYLKIKPNPLLIKLHTRLWQELLPYAHEPNMLYSPSMWHPHVTLALQDLSPEQLEPVLAYVGGQKISWRITIDHYSLLTQTTDGAFILINHFQFNRGRIY